MASNTPDVGRSNRRAPKVANAAAALADQTEKDIKLTIRLSPSLKKRLHYYSIEHNKTMNAVIVDCVAKFLEENS